MRLLQKALTFDDVLLVPAYSNILPRETVLSTQFTRDLRLNIPFCSAAMDTVTEANLAIALAQEGGIGIIHKNMTAQAQAAEVNKVKRHEAGMVADPITIGPDMIVADVIRLTREHNISGLPVVQGEKVLGMVTHRDLRFEDRMDAKISEIMTPAERLITIKEGATLDDAKKLMHEHRLERVLVVDDNFHLRGLMTVKDIIKATEHPYASKDKHGKLPVQLSASEPVRKNVSNCWLTPASTYWLLIQPTAILRACLTASSGLSSTILRFRLLAETLLLPLLLWPSLKTVQTLLKSASARVLFVRLALLPVSVFRRLLPSLTLPKLFKAPVFL